MTTASGRTTLPRARTIGWIALGIVALVLFPHVVKAFFALFAGVLLALFLENVSRFVADKTRLPYKVAVVLLTLLGLGSIVGLALFAGPRFAEQVDKLGVDLRGALDQLRREWEASSLGQAAKPEELKPGAGRLVVGALTGSAEALAGVVVFVFVGVYGAFQPEVYSRAVLLLVPRDKRARAEEVLHDASHTLARWIIGRAVAMGFVGLASAIGLKLMDIPLALVLGVLAGVLAFVEYAGAILSAIPPMLLALSKGPMHAIWVALLFTAIHVVDGYLLTPFVLRKAVRFPPAFTLAAQMLFGAALGVLGLTFATPICVVGVTLIRKLYVEGSLGERDLSLRS